ncbi:porin family protein [Vibrio sp. Sgm 22]|uniref:porin family protein n=1 Tax=unclassified Vibrio TaxID=2614977 RepID=UPI002249890F|nr:MULTISPECIES: porin family protein [unclassified Vibrio]MCX2757750.1 porin family protein [Vibrio sp. 14G-20]MCX2774972.1 porin family protein [Vibrio sp. Sgm 22]
MLKSTFLLGLVGLVSLPTFAAGIEGGPYIGAGLGVYQDSDTDGAGSLDAESVGYSLYGGYQFNRIVGIELGYTDYADYESYGTKVLSPTSLSVAANLGYTFDNSIRPFVLAGLSYVDLNSKGSSIDDDSGAGFHFGVGVEYTPVENLTLRLISQADAVNIEFFGANGNRLASRDVAFSSVTLGASYNF